MRVIQPTIPHGLGTSTVYNFLLSLSLQILTVEQLASAPLQTKGLVKAIMQCLVPAVITKFTKARMMQHHLKA